MSTPQDWPSCFHVSSVHNRRSIRRRGLLTARALSGNGLVWLVSAARVAWALRHARRRHGLPADAPMDVWEVVLCPPRALAIASRPGLACCPADVPAGNLALAYSAVRTDDPDRWFDAAAAGDGQE